MATAISTQTKLEILEQEINSEAFEAFYHIGQKLLEIKTNRLYELVKDDEGNQQYKTWGAYCASGRIDYSKGQADRYIRVSEFRPKLSGAHAHQFSMRQVEELCKCETDNDAKRVAKKAIAKAKKLNQRVTAKLIAQIRDGDDETGRTRKKRDAALVEASLGTHLSDLADLLVDWRISLQQIDLEQWSDLDSAILTRVKTEAKELLRFLET